MQLLSALSSKLQDKELSQEDLDQWQDLLLAPWTKPPSPLCTVALSEFWKETFDKCSSGLAISDDLRAILHLLGLSPKEGEAPGSLEEAVS